ncbi:DUF6114 domain-containing protein [Xylanimonas sp. McL0601]|uniref:DUF6114 domain-containing protein n=1 Tax=Xylanimonas sp. McL0601 TaxID=3414739 RepID=UPI003CEB1A8B
MLPRLRFRQWRQGRPFWGALLTILAGLELFVSGRFDIAMGGVVLQLGFSGLQTTIIPVVIVLAGVLVMLQPVHHVFYGVIALVLSLYSLVAVNGGGIGVGMLLGVIGSIVVVSWMGRAVAAAPPVPSAPPALPEPAEDPFLLFDDGPQPDPHTRRSVAAALSVALVAGGLAGAVPAEGPCILGVILCDLPSSTPSPSASADPSAGPSADPSAVPAPDSSASPSVDPSTAPSPSPADPGLGGAVGAVVDGVLGDDAGAQAPAEPAPTGNEPPSGSGLTAEVPQDVPLPEDEGLPLVLGGNEDVDVYSVPAELKAADLEISGIKAVALVSVPVDGISGKRRNAIKLVADHVKVSGFRLKTYADGGAAGTNTIADFVTMDGDATMYITSLTASGPDGESLRLDADNPPATLTALVLAALNPTVGLLGATSDEQVWSGFRESVWAS